MNSNSFYGFDRSGTLYCSNIDTNRLDPTISAVSAIHSALDHIDADRVHYDGKSLSEILSSLSNSFNHLQESATQVGNSLSGAVDNIKVKPRLKRKDLKTLRYGV